MSFRHGSTLKNVSHLIAVAAILITAGGGLQLTTAQETKRSGQGTKTPHDETAIARGKYIVEGVATCGECHTPRASDGEPDRSHWLEGAPLPFLPAQPVPDWPIVAPRLAGAPPATDAQMITLLMTGIWVNGKPLRRPMPRFHMTPSDAEAVLAYLKSLTPEE